jgi:hypothetical protein
MEASVIPRLLLLLRFFTGRFEQDSKIPYENGRAHARDVSNRGRADHLTVLLFAARPNRVAGD